jgi:hypothetical protein
LQKCINKFNAIPVEENYVIKNALIYTLETSNQVDASVDFNESDDDEAW